MDDIRPVRNNDGLNGYDKRSNQPFQRPVGGQSSGSQQFGSSQYPNQEYSPQFSQSSEQSSSHMIPEHTGKKKSHKGLKFSLVLFILLFFAATGFSGWQYMQVQSLNEDITELNSEVSNLKAQNYALGYDNNDLKRKLDLAQQNNADLLEKCGDECKDTTN